MDITFSPLKWTLCSEDFNSKKNSSNIKTSKEPENYLFITGIINDNIFYLFI